MANHTVKEKQSKNAVKVAIAIQTAGEVSIQVEDKSGEKTDRKKNQRLKTPTQPNNSATAVPLDEQTKILLAILGFSVTCLICVLLVGIAKHASSSKSSSLHSTTAEPSLAAQPTDLRFTIYKKYHDESEHVEKMESTSLEEIRSLLKPLEILWATSEKAYHTADVESKRCWSEMLYKSGFDRFRDKFYGEMTKAWSTFNDMMAEAKKNLKSKFDVSEPWKIVEAEIKMCKNEYKKKVNECWQTFNRDVRNKTDVQFAAAKFDQGVERIRQDFATKATVVRGIFENQTKSARDNFLKGEFDSAFVIYETAVKAAVEEFKWLASSALRYFTLKMKN